MGMSVQLLFYFNGSAFLHGLFACSSNMIGQYYSTNEFKMETRLLLIQNVVLLPTDSTYICLYLFIEMTQQQVCWLGQSCWELTELTNSPPSPPPVILTYIKSLHSSVDGWCWILLQTLVHTVCLKFFFKYETKSTNGLREQQSTGCAVNYTAVMHN